MVNYNKKTEEWKDIKGFEGLYQVSTLGRVKSLDRCVYGKDGRYQNIKGGIKKPSKRKDGYMKVSLYKDGVHLPKYLHRIIAEAFIPNPFEFDVINHKDENPSNNNIDNLEWCTQRYNLLYNDRHIKLLKTSGYKKRTEKMKKPIKVKKKDFEKSFDSITEACLDLGLKIPSVVKCLKGKSNTHYGYTFKYTEKNQL